MWLTWCIAALAADPVPAIEGRLLEAGVRTPIGGFTVEASQGEAVVTVASADDGTFTFVDLGPGPWMVTPSRYGFDVDPAILTVSPDRVAQITFYPVRTLAWVDDVDAVFEVVGRRTDPEVTERALSTEELRYLPGTGGDAVRVVQNLPGVARPPLNVGQLIVRGTAPEDSAYYLDGGRIPIVFHFAGLSTVVNTDVIDEVAFLPGGYGVRYGRTTGGVVDIRTRATLPERSRGYVAVDVFQSTAFVEQRLSDRVSLTVSGRRSYIDAVLSPLLSSGALKVQAPRYYDLSARFLYRAPAGDTFDALVLVSDDGFRVLGEGDAVQIGLQTRFQKLRLQARTSLGDGWRHESTLVVGPDLQAFQIAPDGEAFERTLGMALRSEVFRPLGDTRRFGWRFGVDALGGPFSFVYDVAAFGVKEEAAVWMAMPAAYAEQAVRIGPAAVTGGVRVDPFLLSDGYAAVSVDPRLAVRVGAGTTVVKGSLGQYSQPPGVRQVLADQGGNPDLGFQHTIQGSVGAEQRLGRFVSADVTGFAYAMRDLVVGREDAFRFFSGPPPVGPLDTAPYANEGTGRILGVEALVKLDTERTVGWVSATVSRSTRVKRVNADRTLFEYDQPLVLTALGTHELPKRWRLGARARLSSGNPYTPVVNRTYSVDDRAFVPVYGERDSARLPWFWSLDVRADKEWVFRKWTFAAYLDVQNATNTTNPEVIGWSYDYDTAEPVASLPILPAFGLRGEW